MKNVIVTLGIAAFIGCVFFIIMYAGIATGVVVLLFIAFLVALKIEGDKRKAQEETAWKARCTKSRK